MWRNNWEFHGGIPIDTYRDLPYLPIWRGIILNTILYAAVWYLVISGIGLVNQRLRRLIRMKPWLCTKCRYDLRGISSSKCPECGHARCHL